MRYESFIKILLTTLDNNDTSENTIDTINSKKLDIKKTFPTAMFFGFTGTPIFAVNANKTRTTADIFGDRLHTYTIKNAIRDDNVLGFMVEYIGKYKDKTKIDQSKQHHPRQKFKVEKLPKDTFKYFINSGDAYIFQKKFSNDLPLDLNNPKIFHYHSSISNLCKPDILTMTFDLTKNVAILTNPKLNTNIHSDFVNNTLELILAKPFDCLMIY